MTFDIDNTLTARARMLISGKRLFARLGYEQTSTAAIAREAGTSESQLVRYFQGKAGLLEAIFNESWKPLNEVVEKIVAAAPDGRTALLETFALLTGALEKDHDLAYLFLFEGRRIRGSDREIALSEGFVAFGSLLRLLIHRAQKEGTFKQRHNDAALSAALMGAAESMIRDRVLAHRLGHDAPFSDREVKKVFAALLDGL